MGWTGGSEKREMGWVGSWPNPTQPIKIWVGSDPRPPLVFTAYRSRQEGGGDMSKARVLRKMLLLDRCEFIARKWKRKSFGWHTNTHFLTTFSFSLSLFSVWVLCVDKSLSVRFWIPLLQEGMSKLGSLLMKLPVYQYDSGTTKR